MSETNARCDARSRHVRVFSCAHVQAGAFLNVLQCSVIIGFGYCKHHCAATRCVGQGRCCVCTCHGLRRTGLLGMGNMVCVTSGLHAVLCGHGTHAIGSASIRVWNHAVTQVPAWAGVAIVPCPVVKGLTLHLP